ncbi:hypothetical protein GPECTOR_128g541 [Gonium pectorale]|uniref:Uncharacterized protein n=1 Tax=Gonium pectorale TaxID=33097 RepID=A0A150FYH7_GONPE|nr:hypothetical protein GPECTOR_128g541 [Gonium pectorale]|eukprot:KXZ42638.1 hypothetical protein GPECTOR_128g541 [Gonium pectorale]
MPAAAHPCIGGDSPRAEADPHRAVPLRRGPRRRGLSAGVTGAAAASAVATDPWVSDLTFAKPQLEERFCDFLARANFVHGLMMHAFYVTGVWLAFVLRSVNEPSPAAAGAWGCEAQKAAGAVLPGYPCGGPAGAQARHVLAHALFYFVARDLALRDFGVLFNILAMMAVTLWLLALAATSADKRPAGRSWRSWLRWRGPALCVTPLLSWCLALPATLLAAGPGRWWRLGSYQLVAGAVERPAWDMVVMVLMTSGMRLRVRTMAPTLIARTFMLAAMGAYIELRTAAAADATAGCNPPNPMPMTAEPAAAAAALVCATASDDAAPLPGPLAWASWASLALRHLVVMLPLAALPIAYWWWSERALRRRFMAAQSAARKAAEAASGQADSATATVTAEGTATASAAAASSTITAAVLQAAASAFRAAASSYGRSSSSLGAATSSSNATVAAAPGSASLSSGSGGSASTYGFGAAAAAGRWLLAGGAAAGSRSASLAPPPGARGLTSATSSGALTMCFPAPELQLSTLLSTISTDASDSSCREVGRGGAATAPPAGSGLADGGGGGGSGSGLGALAACSGGGSLQPRFSSASSIRSWWGEFDTEGEELAPSGTDAGAEAGREAGAEAGREAGAEAGADAESSVRRDGARWADLRGHKIAAPAASLGASTGGTGSAPADAPPAPPTTPPPPPVRGILRAMPLPLPPAPAVAAEAPAAAAAASLPAASLHYRGLTRVCAVSVKVHEPTGGHNEYAERLAAAMTPLLFSQTASSGVATGHQLPGGGAAAAAAASLVGALGPWANPLPAAPPQQQRRRSRPQPPGRRQLVPAAGGGRLEGEVARRLPDAATVGAWAVQGPTGRLTTFYNQQPAHGPRFPAAAASGAGIDCCVLSHFVPVSASGDAPAALVQVQVTVWPLGAGLTSAMSQRLRLLLVRHGEQLADFTCVLGPGPQALVLPVPPQPQPTVLQLVFAPAAGAATPSSPLLYDIATLLAVPADVAAELKQLSQVMRMERVSGGSSRNAAAAAAATALRGAASGGSTQPQAAADSLRARGPSDVATLESGSRSASGSGSGSGSGLAGSGSGSCLAGSSPSGTDCDGGGAGEVWNAKVAESQRSSLYPPLFSPNPRPLGAAPSQRSRRGSIPPASPSTPLPSFSALRVGSDASSAVAVAAAVCGRVPDDDSYRGGGGGNTASTSADAAAAAGGAIWSACQRPDSWVRASAPDGTGGDVNDRDKATCVSASRPPSQRPGDAGSAASGTRFPARGGDGPAASGRGRCGDGVRGLLSACLWGFSDQDLEAEYGRYHGRLAAGGDGRSLAVWAALCMLSVLRLLTMAAVAVAVAVTGPQVAWTLLTASRVGRSALVRALPSGREATLLAWAAAEVAAEALQRAAPRVTSKGGAAGECAALPAPLWSAAFAEGGGDGGPASASAAAAAAMACLPPLALLLPFCVLEPLTEQVRLHRRLLLTGIHAALMCCAAATPWRVGGTAASTAAACQYCAAAAAALRAAVLWAGCVATALALEMFRRRAFLRMAAASVGEE